MVKCPLVKGTIGISFSIVKVILISLCLLNPNFNSFDKVGRRSPLLYVDARRYVLPGTENPRFQDTVRVMPSYSQNVYDMNQNLPFHEYSEKQLCRDYIFVCDYIPSMKKILPNLTKDKNMILGLLPDSNVNVRVPGKKYFNAKWSPLSASWTGNKKGIRIDLYTLSKNQKDANGIDRITMEIPIKNPIFQPHVPNWELGNIYAVDGENRKYILGHVKVETNAEIPRVEPTFRAYRSWKKNRPW